jgi:hypothetical protein
VRRGGYAWALVVLLGFGIATGAPAGPTPATPKPGLPATPT